MRNIQDVSYGLFLTDRQLDFLFNYPQGFNRMRCFATFLRMAVKEPTHYVKKEYSVDLTPGQFAVSEVELARLWKCNRKTASKVVDLFHEVGLVSSVPNCRTTVFTVHCIASWAQLFACLHHDAKSGIPHLHILINRIDLDGNLINDSFIGQRATRAAHAVNVKRGWELPEDIHNAHVQEVSAACLSVLERMPRYSWSVYKRHLELLGYKVKEQRDKQGVLHGYTP